MKPSNIGGQALIEGIMMRHDDVYSVAVRKPDQEIEIKTEPYKSVVPVKAVHKIPIVRGVISFIDSMAVGVSTLMYSASFFEEDEEELAKKNNRSEEENQKAEKREQALMYGVFAVSFVIAIAVFMLLPYYLSALLSKVIVSHWWLSLLEAVLRVAIFLGYLALVSRMKDIQRTFMYHGAEHKCINCVENGMPLTVENVMKSSRFHKRCGTSFLFIVVIISAVLLMFVQTDSRIMRIVYRLILIPVIAGISYELLRFAGRHDNPVVNLLSKPGLAMQRLTTREPDASMAEVAIAAVEAVFDWKEYLRENFGDGAGTSE
ncbi:MAG: DUF1385 domain-containing protein [Eubacterium sp.]|nr:DUF1385 domain-containing protein [Eubacterium sp.]